jgi:hypothetical protein
MTNDPKANVTVIPPRHEADILGDPATIKGDTNPVCQQRRQQRGRTSANACVLERTEVPVLGKKLDNPEH